MKGVQRVIVGYSGGKEEFPTYDAIMDSTEAVLIEYDPSIVSYSELLRQWSRQHNPFYEQQSRQYRSAIWYQSDEQRQQAEDHLRFLQTNVQPGFAKLVEGKQKNKKKKSLPLRKIHTNVEPVTIFYKAEEYHQDYLRKHTGGTGFF